MDSTAALGSSTNKEDKGGCSDQTMAVELERLVYMSQE